MFPTSIEDYVNTLEDWERNLLRITGNIRDTEDVTDQINTSGKNIPDIRRRNDQWIWVIRVDNHK
jgi:hypothetical protein